MLRRRTTPAFMSALLMLACHEPDDFSPTAPGTAEALQVSVSSSAIPADGISTMRVSAQIDAGAASANRTLLFKASRGAFLESASDTQAAQVERSVDTAGHAAATLRSDRLVGQVEIEVSVVGKPTVFKRLTVEFTGAEPDQVIQLVLPVSSAPADGETLTPIAARVAAGLPQSRRSVTFTTSRGTFAQGTSPLTVPVGADLHARVDLKSPSTAGGGRITAAVEGVVVERPFTFHSAVAEIVVVSPVKAVLEASRGDKGTTVVNVTLVRGVGRVTEGTLVSVRVVQGSPETELPVIIQGLQPSTANGTLTFTLIVGTLTQRGFADIVVTAPGGATGRARIEIIDPT